VTDDRADAFRFADIGLQRYSARLISLGRAQGGETTEALIAALDVHLGTAEDVIASLKTDSTLARSTDLAVQVHSIDPPHDFILRSIELVAEKVAPEFGWRRGTAEGTAPRRLTW
jgi:hypothetical protein